MDKNFHKQALEWFNRGNHDIETAQLLYDNNGHADSIAFHIHQALEKYLKGYLILNGKKPPRIHDLDTLLSLIISLDISFKDFVEQCEKVSRYYIDNRYPPGPLVDYDLPEIHADLEKALELIRLIHTKIPK